MKLISHRGNLSGPNSCLENHPDSILFALESGFDCEIDLWKMNDKFYLGHDQPQYLIYKKFIVENEGLWIHCKNFEALDELCTLSSSNNIFFHNRDDYTITSKGIIWAYPGVAVSPNCVKMQFGLEEFPEDVYGICSDYIGYYKDLCDKK